MLTNIKIKSLFGLYDYELNFHDSISFVSGPNGFGKTTILKLIEALYSCDLQYLSGIIFDQFDTTLCDCDKITLISIKQEREYSDIEDESDERSIPKVKLVINLTQDNNSLAAFTYNANTADDTASSSDIMQLYMNTLSLTAIKDDRCIYLQSKDTQNSNVVKDINKQILSCKEVIAKELSEILTPDNDNIISEEDYNREYNSIYPELQKLAKYGFIKDIKLPYIASNAGFLSTYIRVLKNIVNASSKIINKLNALQKIVEKCEFANKNIFINADSGIRFIAQNETKSILYFEQLSSGERQIVLLFYELLFKSSINSLVLIDEPELSLHIAWQYLFTENIQSIIMANPQQQYIIFTHSPSIINNRFDCANDLFDIHSNR